MPSKERSSDDDAPPAPSLAELVDLGDRWVRPARGAHAPHGPARCALYALDGPPHHLGRAEPLRDAVRTLRGRSHDLAGRLGAVPVWLLGRAGRLGAPPGWSRPGGSRRLGGCLADRPSGADGVLEQTPGALGRSWRGLGSRSSGRFRRGEAHGPAPVGLGAGCPLYPVHDGPERHAVRRAPVRRGGRSVASAAQRIGRGWSAVPLGDRERPPPWPGRHGQGRAAPPAPVAGAPRGAALAASARPAGPRSAAVRGGGGPVPRHADVRGRRAPQPRRDLHPCGDGRVRPPSGAVHDSVLGAGYRRLGAGAPSGE